MVDDSDPEAESDLRRRAAWLLVMLAIVAVLLVVVISAVVKTNKSDPSSGGGPGPLDHQATGASSSSPAGHPSSHPRKPPHPPNHGAGSSTARTSAPAGSITCPGAQTCILQGDVGNGISAINSYRAQHGLPSVPGSVTTQAQTCAVHNGNGCSGGWAETELATPNGKEAVQKILPFAHLDDPNMNSVEVGWAYDPGAKLYYFAIVRNG